MAEEVMTQEQGQAILKAMELMQKQYAEMLNKMDKLERQQNVVQSFLSAITEAQDFGKTMQEIEKVTKDVTKADKATFYCCDNAENKFFVQNNESRDYCIDSDSPENIMLSDMKNDAEQLNGNNEWKVFRTDENSVYIPIISNDSKVLGIVEAVKESGFQNADDFDIFKPHSEIINTIDLAIQKELSHQVSITDELTGLKTRKGLNEYLKDTMCANLNEGRPVNILMCDIDHFKNVNDTYGHDAGDVVLSNVAKVLKDSTKSGADSVFRFGGEEMICIINGDADKAYEKAENLRKAIENSDNLVLSGGKPVNLKVTVSMGLYQIDPSVGMQFTKENSRALFDSEFKHADDLMYAAKKDGRNRIKTTEDIYNSYLVSKSAEVIGVNAIAEQAMTEIKSCVETGDSNSIIEAAESIGADMKESENLKADFYNRDRNTHELDNGKIGNVSYLDIKPQYRAFISDVTENQVRKLIPKLEEQGIKYSGIRNSSGNYTLTVNKYDVKNVKGMLYESQHEQPFKQYRSQSYQPQQYSRQRTQTYQPAEQYGNRSYNNQYRPQNYSQTEQEQRKEPTFYNKNAYNGIQNKTFIQTDAKTAYAISQEAQRDGVNFSAKFDGERSAVTVDGRKDRSFIEKIKSIREWADKVHLRAAPIKQKQYEQQQKRSHGGGAR